MKALSLFNRLACAAAIGVASLAAQAQTLADIRGAGKLVIGVQAEVVPFGFTDERGNNVGNDIDVARLLAEDLKVKPEFVRVTGANRIPMLTAGKVDVLVSAMTITAERAKVVQFVRPYSRADTTVFGASDKDIKNVADLANYKVGVTRGSAFDTLLTKEAPQATAIRRFNDDAGTAQAILSGQVDAIVGAVTYGVVIARAGMQDKIKPKFTMSDNILGIAVRPGQKELTDYLNAFLERHIANGDMGRIYEKWVGTPLPALPATLPGIQFTVQ